MARLSNPATGKQLASRIVSAAGKILPSDTRLHHRALILRHLFGPGPASRADLARFTGLARVTVSDVVAGLIADGLVIELGLRPGTHMGKPATLVGINRDGAFLACLDLSDDREWRGALVNLAGERIVEHRVVLRGDRGEDAVDRTVELSRRLLLDAPGRVLGVGIGTPGIVDAAGEIRQAANLNWTSLPLGQQVHDALGVPVYVANDADTAALAEDAFGEGDDSGLLLVEVRHGVGAGILIDGNLLRGPAATAGEIGHLTVDVTGPECVCGRFGCLETSVSAPNLRARIAGQSPGEAEETLRTAGTQLGRVLAPIVQGLGLNDIVLSGPEDLLSGPFREACQNTVSELTRAFSPQTVQVRMSALGRDGVLTGAAALVLSEELGLF